ncbi:MAG: nucleotidyltransferase domain-containing protein [Deltaproteobacteria bacterium]|nr:nucleotidyltransferase domain-containing protein [Deltaproteobacteria bacterium]
MPREVVDAGPGRTGVPPSKLVVELTPAVEDLVEVLTGLRGAHAIVLGGSRASGTNDASSDWDLGVYYRGDLDLPPLAAHGVVHPPGSWGRLMNGGAWLRLGDAKVDVLLRDLDTVERWSERAERGEFEIDALLGYVAGAPTYLLTAELAWCRVLRGVLHARPFPELLAAEAPARWRFRWSFSLDHARMHARRGDVVAALGQAAKAALEEAHAVLCARREWTCNEKGLLEKAGLARLRELCAAVAASPVDLLRWVDGVAAEPGVAANEPRPWR